MNLQDKKIAIIGGGISGLYFANLLQKNQNYQYKVFEKMSKKCSKKLGEIQVSFVYANEADLLNVALFGIIAKQWRDANPKTVGNLRDEATLEQLVVLSNLESFNADMMRNGIARNIRFQKLYEISKYQLEILNKQDFLKSIKKSENPNNISKQHFSICTFESNRNVLIAFTILGF